jgi:hypothetical protein
VSIEPVDLVEKPESRATAGSSVRRGCGFGVGFGEGVAEDISPTEFSGT